MYNKPNLKDVKRIIGEYPEIINKYCEGKWLPIGCAISSKNFPIVRFLIKAGVNLYDNYFTIPYWCINNSESSHTITRPLKNGSTGEFYIGDDIIEKYGFGHGTFLYTQKSLV